MQWFWEPAHYKKELGELLLTRMLNQERTTQDEPATNAFGILLTQENINIQSKLNSKRLKESLLQWQYLQAQLKK